MHCITIQYTLHLVIEKEFLGPSLFAHINIHDLAHSAYVSMKTILHSTDLHQSPTLLQAR